MKKLREILNTKRIFLDGGTGTLLQRAGLPAGTPPERWNLDNPSAIEALHLSYFKSGSDIVATNTFGVNAKKYDNYEEYIISAVSLARSARDRYYAEGGVGEKYIALDIGPSGKMLEPLGDLKFEDAVELFAKNVRCAVGCGVDLILIETMNDKGGSSCGKGKFRPADLCHQRLRRVGKAYDRRVSRSYGSTSRRTRC